MLKFLKVLPLLILAVLSASCASNRAGSAVADATDEVIIKITADMRAAAANGNAADPLYEEKILRGPARAMYTARRYATDAATAVAAGNQARTDGTSRNISLATQGIAVVYNSASTVLRGAQAYNEIRYEDRFDQTIETQLKAETIRANTTSTVNYNRSGVPDSYTYLNNSQEQNQKMQQDQEQVAKGGDSSSSSTATGGAGGNATGGNATGGNSNATGGNSNATGGNANATGGNSNATGGAGGAGGAGGDGGDGGSCHNCGGGKPPHNTN